MRGSASWKRRWAERRSSSRSWEKLRGCWGSDRVRIGRSLTAQDQSPSYPKSIVARALRISRQALYTRPLVVAARRTLDPSCEDALDAVIRELCAAYPRFGTRRVTAMIRRRLAGSGAARGVINRKTVQRRMRRLGLLLPQRRRPRPAHPGTIHTSRPNEVWATDLSKIPTREGWLWIVAVIDCYDRDLVGYRTAATADTRLCLAALIDAVDERYNGDLDQLANATLRLTHDWGSQFTSRAYQAELRTLAITDRPTMIGSPEQNGIMERFYGSLKDEEVWTTEYETRTEATQRITTWIQHYRTEPPHQALNYRTPLEQHAHWHQQLEPTHASLAA